MVLVYATADQLATWLGLEEPPAGATVALRDASLAVDVMLLGAVYATDADGRPTDAHVAEVLRDATCAQAAFKPRGGNTPAPEGGRLSAAKVDKVSQNFATNPTTGKVIEEPHSSQALDILRIEGLIPAHPRAV